MSQPNSPTQTEPTPLPRKFWRRASWALVLSVAGHVFAAAAYNLFHAPSSEHPGTLRPLLAVALGVVVFGVCGYLGHGHRLHSRPVLWLIIGAILGGHWVGLGLHELTHAWPQLLVALAGLGLVLLAIFGLHDLTEEEDAVRLLELYPGKATKEPERFRALVLCVSRPDYVPQMIKGDAKLIAQIGADPKNPVVQLTGDIGADLERLRTAPSGFDWNWEQILRALQPHTKLETICLIGSKSRNPNAKPKDAGKPDERDGSDIYLRHCANWLRGYFKACEVKPRFLYAKPSERFEDFVQLQIPEVDGPPTNQIPGVPFEDFVALRDHIRNHVRALTKPTRAVHGGSLAAWLRSKGKWVATHGKTVANWFAARLRPIGKWGIARLQVVGNWFAVCLQRIRKAVGLDAHKRDGLDPRSVTVDVTGGFKVTSIAGAVVTLRRECVCQYVPTEDVRDSGRDPLIYDFRASPGAGHH